MTHRLFLLFGLLNLYSFIAQAQAFKTLDHADFKIWNTIHDHDIAADGQTIIYRVVPGEGDPSLHIYSKTQPSTLVIQRVSKARLDYDGQYVIGVITPKRDSLRALERKKVEKKDWPCDTLFIYQVNTGATERIPFINDFKLPARKGGWLAYTLKSGAWPIDTSDHKKKSGKDAEHLIARQLSSGQQDTLMYVKDYAWADKSAVLVAIASSKDSLHPSGVAYWSNHEWTFIKKQKGTYAKPSLPQDGNQIAFLGNLDTAKAQVEPWQLFYFDFRTDSATSIAVQNKTGLPLVSKDKEPQWSDDGKYLYYGRAEMPEIQDTTLLADEKVDVEIWSTNDPVLYTVQNVRKPQEEKRSYAFVYDTQSKLHIGIGSPKWESVVYGPEKNGRYAVVFTEKPYQKEGTWMGDTPVDMARVDLLTGAVLPIKKGLFTYPAISPGNTFAYGYSDADSTWWACELTTGVFSLMPKHHTPALGNELHDAPGFPNGYGHAGWIKGDQSLIFYDRYDMWAWSGKSDQPPVKLTRGRETGTVYRYIRTDTEVWDMRPDQPWLVNAKDDSTKMEDYVWFEPSTFSVDSFSGSAYDLTRQVKRARNAETYLFTKENFTTFPDLMITEDRFVTEQKISDANPQQKDYHWGTIQLYEWQDENNQHRTGLLVLPAQYDSSKVYPVIANFYERSTDGLYHHPTPEPHRSTINYAFYASRGYVIFNPDITYIIGAPGESAYQIVISGVQSLVSKGIGDPKRLALQGHSWGGYQVAYILTRTNMFRCAEAGAAVVNMTSAYGGIRWESGRARLFQYEKEQSRLGQTLWGNKNLYLNNSPLFQVDKITTPLLLLHNDKDGAVPFEQGIEFYLALRRLGKEAWLLNYKGEPHWPVKWENKVDFNIRMAEFFDHYLKGAARPEWMT